MRVDLSQGGGANQDEGGHSVPQGNEEYQNGEGGGQDFIRMMCFRLSLSHFEVGMY